MKDFFEFIAMLYLVAKAIVHTAIFIIGLFFLPHYIWKHYDDQKKRSAEIAFMAKKMGMQIVGRSIITWTRFTGFSAR